MKLGLFIGLILAAPAFATFDLDCGKKPNGSHEVALSIEDDGAAEPQHWSFYVNGKKPHSLSETRLKKLSSKRIDVIVNDGGDSVWTDYKFTVRGECDGETATSKVDIYRRYVTRSEFRKTLSCSCTED